MTSSKALYSHFVAKAEVQDMLINVYVKRRYDPQANSVKVGIDNIDPQLLVSLVPTDNPYSTRSTTASFQCSGRTRVQ